MVKMSDIKVGFWAAIVVVCMVIAGCASTPLQEKRDHVISCVKDMIANGAGTAEAYEVCRQVYGIKKVID